MTMFLRWDGQAMHEHPDELAEEEPLEMRGFRFTRRRTRHWLSLRIQRTSHHRGETRGRGGRIKFHSGERFLGKFFRHSARHNRWNGLQTRSTKDFCLAAHRLL